MGGLGVLRGCDPKVQVHVSMRSSCGATMCDGLFRGYGGTRRNRNRLHAPLLGGSFIPFTVTLQIHGFIHWVFSFLHTKKNIFMSSCTMDIFMLGGERCFSSTFNAESLHFGISFWCFIDAFIESIFPRINNLTAV